MREVLKHYSFEGGPLDREKDKLPALIDEAQDYAQRMSKRLIEYKAKEGEHE